MRTDATIDKRQVVCKNADHSGFNKLTAQVGDLVMFRDQDSDGSNPGDLRMARMIARVAYAPALDGDKGPVRDFILAVVLSSDMTWTSERWINPLHVVRVQALRNHVQIMEWFLGSEMETLPVDEVRQMLGEGWSTPKSKREHEARRVK